MIKLLLLGILIMQIITFHYNTVSSGRYMKVYDILSHRLPKYLTRKTVEVCCNGYSKGKESYHKVKDKIKEV